MKMIRLIKLMSITLLLCSMTSNMFGMEHKKHEKAHMTHKKHVHVNASPETIVRDCTHEDFVFLDEYETLSKEDRKEVVVMLDKKVVEIADSKNVHKIFETLPEGYLKMKVRARHYFINKKNIDEVPIKEIMYKIYGPAQEGFTKNTVFLSKLGLTSFEGIADLLVVRNETQPITELYLSENQFTTVSIPEALTSLQMLNLEYNKNLVHVSIPILKALKLLHITNTPMESLNLPAMPALDSLYLNNNKLKFVNIEQAHVLRVVYLDHNELKTFDITENMGSLEFLNLSNNPLKKLQLPGTLSITQTLYLEVQLDNTQLSDKDKRSLAKKIQIKGMERIIPEQEEEAVEVPEINSAEPEDQK